MIKLDNKFWVESYTPHFVSYYRIESKSKNISLRVSMEDSFCKIEFLTDIGWKFLYSIPQKFMKMNVGDLSAYRMGDEPKIKKAFLEDEEILLAMAEKLLG